MNNFTQEEMFLLESIIKDHKNHIRREFVRKTHDPMNISRSVEDVVNKVNIEEIIYKSQDKLLTSILIKSKR